MSLVCIPAVVIPQCRNVSNNKIKDVFFATLRIILSLELYVYDDIT